MYIDTPLFTEFISAKEILWLGIDFTLAKFTRKGFEMSQDALRTYFNEWNQLIISDQKKYDIRMSFRKPVMQYDLSVVTKLNKSLKINDVLTKFIGIKDVLKDEQMCQYITGLQFPQTLKYALTFVVESFDSGLKNAAIWVIVVETATREVVLCEKFLKKPAGIGTRNYWARTFYNVFYDIQSNSFMRWENMVKDKIGG